MKTRDEYAAEAERLLAQAEGEYLDDSNDAAPREEYASEEEWVRALEEGVEAHEAALRTAGLFTQMAQAYAALATAAPADAVVVDGAALEELAALRSAVAEMLHNADVSSNDGVAAVVEQFRYGLTNTVHGEPVLAGVEALTQAMERDAAALDAAGGVR